MNKEQSAVEAKHLKESLIETLYSRALKNPMIFGYNLGDAVGMTNDLILMGAKKLPAENQQEYIKGIAWGVAMRDLGTDGIMVRTNEEVRRLMEAQSTLEYNYLWGILS